MRLNNQSFKLCEDPHDTVDFSFFVRNPDIDGAKWPAFTPEQQEYVTLNYNHPEVRTMMKAKECHLWNKLIPKMEKVSG